MPLLQVVKVGIGPPSQKMPLLQVVKVGIGPPSQKIPHVLDVGRVDPPQILNKLPVQVIKVVLWPLRPHVEEQVV